MHSTFSATITELSSRFARISTDDGQEVRVPVPDMHTGWEVGANLVLTVALADEAQQSHDEYARSVLNAILENHEKKDGEE
jgi:hypothetical protein